MKFLLWKSNFNLWNLRGSIDSRTMSLTSFYRWGNWGQERLLQLGAFSNLRKKMFPFPTFCILPREKYCASVLNFVFYCSFCPFIAWENFPEAWNRILTVPLKPSQEVSDMAVYLQKHLSGIWTIQNSTVFAIVLSLDDLMLHIRKSF